jgi:phage FluMu protein Com
MPIQFPCPGCGKVLAVGEESAGHQAKCPHCELVSLVPESTSTIYDAELVGGAEATRAGPAGSPFDDPPEVMTEPINSHLVDAILITLCCLTPFGIVGIIFAAMCKKQIGVGNYALARKYSEKSHLWNMIGLWTTLGLGFFYLLSTCGAGGG